MTSYLGASVKGAFSSPPPVVPGGAAAIPLGEFSAYTDPANWAGSARLAGSFVANGHHFTPGEVTSNEYPEGQSWTVGNKEIHSFSSGAAAGETLRFGVRKEPGLAGNAFRLRTVFDSNSTYQVQSGATNSTVLSPPSDRLYRDGTRIQIDYADTGTFVRSGPGADTVIMSSIIKYDNSIYANDQFATLFNIHAPNAIGGASSGQSCYWQRGTFLITERHASNFSSGSAASSTMYSSAASSFWANKWIGFVMEMKMSPNLADGPFCRVWRRQQDESSWSQIVNHNAAIGYTFSPSSANDFNFPVGLSYYQFHNGNPTDLNYKLRQHHYGFFGFMKNPSRTTAEVRAHLDSYF